jgi:peptidoglycan L-alanyl-D-glutamate endopeptidase CwlK
MAERGFEKVRGDLAEKAIRLLMAMDCLGHPIFIVETYRSQERQAALYAKGRTEPGARVTWTLNSMHTQGRAVDVAFEADEPWSEAHPWELLRACAEAIGLTGLGARDRGHWQV